MPNVKDNVSSKETRRKLIEAAGQTFAERGLHAATLQEITDRAGANKAAVNYHFHDKFELYAAVVRHALSHGGLPHAEDQAGSPQRRLRALITRIITDIFDPARPAWSTAIISHELAQPTAALEAVIKDLLEPRVSYQRAIVREILGPRAAPQLVAQMTMSVMAQCLFYLQNRATIRRLLPEATLNAHSVKRIAAHIGDFSMAALRAARRRCNAKPARNAAPRRGHAAKKSRNSTKTSR